SADVLDSAIEAAVAGRPDVEAIELLARLRVLAAAETTQRANTPHWTPAIAAADGPLVRVRLAPDTPLAGVRAFMIVQAVGRLGTLSNVTPSLDELNSDAFAGEVSFHLATVADGAEIERTIRAMGDVATVSIAGQDAEPRSEATNDTGYTA